MGARGRTGSSRGRRSSAALVAVAALAAVLGGTTPARAEPTADGSASAALVDPSIGIDTNDPVAVGQAWDALLAAPGDQGLTGNAATCTPGTTSQAYRTKELATVNAMRKLAGVAPWTETAALSVQAQKAAALMAANNTISHTPPNTWACWSQAGYDAAYSSNLAQGTAGAGAQRAYLEDAGSGNEFAGHRRYLLCGSIATTGFGDFGGFNATRTGGLDTGNWQSRDGYVAWPYPGIVPPARADTFGALDLWSFQVPPGDQTANATVSISASSGGAVTANVQGLKGVFCGNAITWKPSRAPADGQNWTVTVGNIAAAGGGTYSKTYVVKFTDAVAGVPGAPTNVTATGGNGQATVSWTAAPANGSTITGYSVVPSIGGTAQAPVAFDASATSRTITGLTNGTSYTFKVFARTASAIGPLSSASASVLVAGPPGVPTGVSATAGNAQATVSWSAPSSGGTPITGYVVTRYVGGSAQGTSNAAGTSTTVGGLTNGTAYTFKVAAVNARGTSGQSSASAAVTPSVPVGPAYAPFASWVDFVNRQYLDLTKQAPSSAARASWVSQLGNGTKAKGDLIEALRRGSDNTGNVDPVVRLYRAFLGRTPDAGGLVFWIGRKRAGTWTVTRMADSFAASDEFKATYGTLSNRAFVTRIYTDVLGRTADASGVDYWTRKLDTKARTRGSVMVGFSESGEYRTKQAENTDVAVAHTFLLGRAPTSTEESSWVNRQKAGTPQATLATELLNSAAYATRITG